MKLITSVAFASALVLSSAYLWAGPQQHESVVEAARKAQAAKKANPNSPKVITNEDLAQIKGDVSVVGPEPTPPQAPAAGAKPAAPNAVAPEAGKPPVKDEAYWRKAFADARKTLADDEHELDVLQREYNLKQQQYYSDPNTALREQYDRKDLTDTQKSIDDKTAAVAKDKQAVSDLEDALRQAGGDASWASPPAETPEK